MISKIYGDMWRFANAENILSQSTRFLLEKAEAAEIVATMEMQIKNTWYTLARAAGVSEQDCQKISSAFNYPGFRLI